MPNIVKRLSQLPIKAEALAEYILVGKQVLKAQKAKLAAINAVAENSQIVRFAC